MSIRPFSIPSILALIAVSSQGVTQIPTRKPDRRNCAPQVKANLPALGLTVSNVADQYDLSYATKPGGVVEVSFLSKKGGGRLVFIGVEHVSSPQPKLFDYFEEIVAREQPAAVYIEVNDASYIAKLPHDKLQVIQSRGEPSYIGFVARQASIPVLPLEPSASYLRGKLRNNFSSDRVTLAYVLRDVQISRDRQRLFGEALEAQAVRALTEQGRLASQAGEKSTIKNVFQLTQAVNSQWPGLDWRQAPAEWFNPLLLSSETDSKFINDIFKKEMDLRDSHALELLLRQVVQGKHVIALAGRSHAQNHLQTLSCMMAGL